MLRLIDNDSGRLCCKDERTAGLSLQVSQGQPEAAVARRPGIARGLWRQSTEDGVVGKELTLKSGRTSRAGAGHSWTGELLAPLVTWYLCLVAMSCSQP